MSRAPTSNKRLRIPKDQSPDWPTSKQHPTKWSVSLRGKQYQLCPNSAVAEAIAHQLNAAYFTGDNAACLIHDPPPAAAIAPLNALQFVRDASGRLTVIKPGR
jgi:hypothetical protein